MVAEHWWKDPPSENFIEVLRSINTFRRNASNATQVEHLDAALKLLSEIVPTQFRVERSTTSRTLDETESILDEILQHPSQRLAVYGTLKPGEVNEGQLSGIEGDWLNGNVHGVITQPGDYLEFTWIVDAPAVPVKVFAAPTLKQHFHRLDEFEGPDYFRTLVPVSIYGRVHVCNIYEGRIPATLRDSTG
jgi:gamma-glutamylcyclotransferase (GGCT)/AIG2-like uncharacterized protein YtfP